jgi:peptidyl-prolyl cis-trans isomerase SurA
VRSTRRHTPAWLIAFGVCAAVWLAPVGASAQTAAPAAAEAPRRTGDFIVAVVNRELVTNSEVQARMTQVEENARNSRAQLPAADELRRQVLDQLIDERAQLGYARESGVRVDEVEIDRAVAAVAAQNQLTPAQLRERMRSEGVDIGRFREALRDQITLDRIREREMQGRVKVSDNDIQNWLAEQRTKAGLSTEYNIAQILVAVPEGVSGAEAAKRRAIAISALQRLRAGEDFARLVRELSDGSRDNGGQIGMRSAARLPDLFVEAVSPLRVGEVAPQVVRSGAGFHVLKLIERKDADLRIVQQHARHILIKPGTRTSERAAITRLAGFKRDIEAGKARFDDLARRFSEDGSAANGGDLGWASPGQFVPEFERALDVLDKGDISEPLVSRFGVHLIQLLERREVKLDARQQREAARSALREQRQEEAMTEWAREVRSRAYVELREAPQ